MSDRIDDITWPVTTARLTLRRATGADLDATWRYRRLPEANRWLTHAPSTREAFAENISSPERLRTTLLIELEGLVVGDLMLRIEDAWAQGEVAEQARGVQAELGWCLDPAVQGRGYASEAIQELIKLCFEELDLRRVTASCFADNAASWRLMERLGMRRETHAVRDSLHRSGEWLDGYTYALLAEEWRPLPSPH